MHLLIDTHFLLWSTTEEEKLPAGAYALMDDPGNTLWFSAVSIWEIAIKRSLNKADFRIDPGPMRAGLIRSGFSELPFEGRQVLPLAGLSAYHSDPFDRLLLSQAISEGLILVTSDRELAKYDGPIQYFGLS